MDYGLLISHKWKILGIASVMALLSMGLFSKTEPVPSSSSVPSFKEGENSVTFIGHGTVLIHINGTNILTDPNFGNGLIIFRRNREAGLKIENLPKIDAILISHAHRDHLDAWTMKQLPKDTPVLISKGNGKYPRGWGFIDVRELDVGDEVKVKGAKVTATPAKHSGARNSATADYPAALGYMIEGSKTVYFAGDTGLFGGFKEIGDKYKIDVALLPVGAYRPRWFMKSHHMSPEDALSAFEMLKAKEMIPIHFGSFRMAFDKVDEPKEVLVKLLRNSGLKERVHLLENGETYLF